MMRWTCEGCQSRKPCMANVLRKQPFARPECNEIVPRTHQTAARAAVSEFLATHTRFTRLDMRAFGLTEQQVVYHLRRCEDIGVIRRVQERYGLKPAVYEVQGEY